MVYDRRRIKAYHLFCCKYALTEKKKLFLNIVSFAVKTLLIVCKLFPDTNNCFILCCSFQIDIVYALRTAVLVGGGGGVSRP